MNVNLDQIDNDLDYVSYMSRNPIQSQQLLSDVNSDFINKVEKERKEMEYGRTRESYGNGLVR